MPAAFYRHFRDMDELGLALVDDVCLRLRQIIREARASARNAPDAAIQPQGRGREDVLPLPLWLVTVGAACAAGVGWA